MLYILILIHTVRVCMLLTYQHWQTQSQICALILSLSGTIPPTLGLDCDKEDTVKENTHINTYISYSEISWRVSDNKQHLVALWAPKALNITLPAVQHSFKKKTKQMWLGPGRAFKLILSFMAWRHFVLHVFLFSQECYTQPDILHSALRALQPCVDFGYRQAHTERKLSRFTQNSNACHSQSLNILRPFCLSLSNI